MFRKLVMASCLAILAVSVGAQGIDTRASKDDWEEINFDFNSSILVDGFPSLLRLAELLEKTPVTVQVEGRTDEIGNQKANEKLGLARANSVRDFLVKYGARTTRLKSSPAAN